MMQKRQIPQFLISILACLIASSLMIGAATSTLT
jgi:hypothetical protein